jgi:hypothetical protein
MKREPDLAAVEMPRRPTLAWQRPNGETIRFPVQAGQRVTLGRDAANAIPLESPFVSKEHAVLEVAAGHWTLEDLGSANGTRVNGVPISIYTALKVGDVIEVGDQQLVFEDASPRRRAAAGASEQASGSKMVRLAAVAGVTAILMVIGLRMLIPVDAGETPAAAPVARRATGPAKAVHLTDHALIAGVLARAKLAGVPEVDALFDEAIVCLETGRLKEAVQLLGAVLQRRQDYPLARERLGEAQAELEQAIAAEIAEGERLMTQLRFLHAARSWERVVALTYPGDPRHDNAQRRLAEARQRLER